MNEIIKINGLSVDYKSRRSVKNAVRDINLSFFEGEKAAIVGESGCGKSTLALAITGLLNENAVVRGTVITAGIDIYSADRETLRNARGTKFGMIFQDPGASLNPLFRIKDHFEAAVHAHDKSASSLKIRSIATDHFQQTGIKDTERVYESYPHQLSGGMQQRVMTALALCMNPEILIADEPTTALDTTVQAQISLMLEKLQKQNNLTLILVTHDLHFAEMLCERMIIMYAGEVVESFMRGEKPKHRYTKALFDVIPVISRSKKEFNVIPGEVPDNPEKISCCSFANRCSAALEICHKEKPEMFYYEKGSYKCFNPADK